MPEHFWIKEYQKKASLPDPIAQSGRGQQFKAVEFLYVVKQAIEFLDLQPEHDLLDVGCGNGLIDVVLSACCRSILAVEPVEELVELARRNLANCPNVRVEVGHGAAIGADQNSFDRVLVLGVIQLLPPAEVKDTFYELQRVTRRGGCIFFGSISDARYRNQFLEPYLEGVRLATHLSDQQKTEIITRNMNAHWYDPAELIAWWNELNCRAKSCPLSPADPNVDHRYHLLVTV